MSNKPRRSTQSDQSVADVLDSMAVICSCGRCDVLAPQFQDAAEKFASARQSYQKTAIELTQLLTATE